MDPRFLRYYERELKQVRELGGEFARDFPKIAGRLGIDAFECADPYVERLLEAFAFLAARVQLKLDAEFPAFVQHMLELLYPSYLAPTPSMAVVQLRPNMREGSLTDGFVVPRGTSLRSRSGAGQTPCEYRTAHDVTLWPVELSAVDYSTVPGEFIDVERTGAPKAHAALRMVLRSASGTPLNKLALDRLPLFLRGRDETTSRLYEQLTGAVVGVVVQSTARPVAFREVIAGNCVARIGFDDDQALLPCDARGFQGQRLLQEYFAFPERYLFAELRGLNSALRASSGDQVEIVVLFGRSEASLEGVVSPGHLALFCTPSINLFPRTADRIHLTDRDHEYHVLPDRTRPLDLEVYSVTQVTGYGTRTAARREFLPMYALNARTAHSDQHSYFTVRRQPRTISTRERARGPRSSYVGSETYVSLVDGQHGPFEPGMRQLGVSTLCTNRDLPLQMSIGQGETDFTAQSGAPIESVRTLAGPTPPRASPAYGQLSWRLLSHLSLDYLALTQDDPKARGASVRELLSLYADLSDPATIKQIQGLVSVETKSVVRPLPLAGALSFGRGLEVTLACDEAAFEGSGVVLLGAVLERFFAKYASINSFTETVLRSAQRGEIMRWPTTPGRRQIL
ncbi:MAG TPA: type VI secretion system baseplate subunit TssF [Polyangiales bacterium]